MIGTCGALFVLPDTLLPCSTCPYICLPNLGNSSSFERDPAALDGSWSSRGGWHRFGSSGDFKYSTGIHFILIRSGCRIGTANKKPFKNLWFPMGEIQPKKRCKSLCPWIMGHDDWHWYSPGWHQSGKGCSLTRQPTKCDLGFLKTEIKLEDARARGMNEGSPSEILFGLPEQERTKVTIGGASMCKTPAFMIFPTLQE